MSNVIQLPCMTTLRINPIRMLANIASEITEDCDVIVIVKGKDITTYHSSNPERAKNVYELELMKYKLINGDLG